MLRRRRAVIVVVAALVAIVAGWAVFGVALAGPARGDFLADGARGLGPGGWDEIGQGGAVLGQHYDFTVWLVDAKQGDQPIHLLKAEVMGFGPGVKVDRVMALRNTEGGQDALFMLGGPDQVTSAGRVPRSVDAVTIRPVCQPGGGLLCYGWFLVAELHVDKPGTYESSGVRVTYRVGSTTYYQDFAHRIKITTDRAR
jgi:hypothetical protein